MPKASPITTHSLPNLFQGRHFNASIMVPPTTCLPAHVKQPKFRTNDGTAPINDDSGTGKDHQTTYAVLYYKRKNKVHRSRGVSKMDGILTVIAPPKSLVSLVTSTGTTVVAARRECEIAAKDWEDDSIFNLGSYEVEILSHFHGSTRSRARNSQELISPPPRLATTALVFSSAKNNSVNLVRRRGTEPIQETKTGVAFSSLHIKAHFKTVQQQALPMISSSAPKQFCVPRNSSGQIPAPTISDTATCTRTLKSLEGTMQYMSFPTVTATAAAAKNPGSTLKRRLPLTSTTLGAPQSRAKRPNAPLYKSRQAKSSLTRGLTGKSSSSLELFSPGAVGTINLPHSIASVLKLHQRSGLVFVWNCLNGTVKKSAKFRSVMDNSEEDGPPTATSTYKGGCILADEMGLGKTLLTIAVICALYRQRRDKKYIVVCPSSLVSNWANEFDKWLGNACQPKRVVVHKGGQEAVQQIKVFCQPVTTHQAPQVLILSFDIFRRNVDIFQGMPSCLTRLLVVDEGHRLKNTAKSLTLTALESLQCESRLLLTATPIQNVLSDFYTIADFCCPGLLGDLTTFRREFERPISTANNKSCTLKQRQRGAEQSRILDEISKTFMLRRLQKDVLKTVLPLRQELMLFCWPSPLQCSLYQQLKIERCGDTAEALKTLTSLRKLCLHPSLCNSRVEGTHPIISDSGKLSVLDQLLVEMKRVAPDDKVVIVSNFTSALTLIERSILQPRGLSYLRLDGRTELSNRQSVVDTFNKTSSGRTFAFLLSSKAGGCGLNLIGANRLIMFDPDWNPASDAQAMARIWRQGQQKPCTIYRLFTSGTIEEVICQRQIHKGNLSSGAIDCKTDSAPLGFTKEELRDCFTLKNCACDTKEKAGDSWLPYDGPGSIVDMGCNDYPLLQVASHALELAFVHLVTDAPQDDCTEASEKENYSIGMTSEEEWDDSGSIRVADYSHHENLSEDDEKESEGTKDHILVGDDL